MPPSAKKARTMNASSQFAVNVSVRNRRKHRDDNAYPEALHSQRIGVASIVARPEEPLEDVVIFDRSLIEAKISHAELVSREDPLAAIFWRS